MRRLCVFCGSSKGHKQVHADAAQRLGRAMAERGLGLVYGGGHIGLMGVLADTMLAGGGKVIGVIPKSLEAKELAHGSLTELHVVETMHQRKAAMADLSDAFAALPGGYGTADELFEILTWAQLGLHRKAIGLLNVEGFFDPLLAWIDRCNAEGFIREKHRHLLRVACSEAELLTLLDMPAAEEVSDKWISAEDR
jgi:uncharacterized protein (TIGR00730 family)